MTSKRKKIIEEVKNAMPITSLRFGAATPIVELFQTMEISKDLKMKRKVLNLLLSGHIPDIILTSTSSDIRIAVNSPIWIENNRKEPFYIPIKNQRREVGHG